MAKIFISMSGEGRGHATRVRSLVEKMRAKHEISLFAPGEAYEFLKHDYSDSADVRLVKIPGLKFHYVNGRLNLPRSVYKGLRFRQFVLPRLVKTLVEEIQQQQPDVILSDFEPALPRAAQRCGLPFLSLTHQHFLLAYDLSWLPTSLQFFAWFTGLAVPLHYTGQKVTMISSFFLADLKPAWEKRGAISLGPMIRAELQTAAREKGLLTSSLTSAEAPAADGESFLLSYLRKYTPEQTVNELVATGERIKIYGLGERPARGAVTFHAVDPQTFVDDLVDCRAVVSAAGNQLLGECMYLGKPVLALPETWHHEQLINACFLKRMGCGNYVTLETFSRNDIAEFLNALPMYREKIAQTCLGREGTQTVVDILEEAAACHSRTTAGSCS